MGQKWSAIDGLKIKIFSLELNISFQTSSGKEPIIVIVITIVFSKLLVRTLYIIPFVLLKFYMRVNSHEGENGIKITFRRRPDNECHHVLSMK